MLPDDKHNGLLIRTYLDCGAQSSQVIVWDSDVKYDANDDGLINISDVTTLINYLLSGIWE